MAKTKKENLVVEIEDTVAKAASNIIEQINESVEKITEETKKKKVTKKAKTEKTDEKAETKEEKDSKDDKKAKFAKLLEKAKQLEKEVEEKEFDIKKKIKEEEKKDTLVPMEDYLKSSIHLGTRVITPDMRSYVYRRRADGLAVFNTALLDDKMREGAEYLAKFAPENIIVVCKREAGWKAVKKFAEITGIRVFTKKYPAGILTNTSLDNFMETELLFVCDPWLDKNALNDALRVGIPILSVCDTNNYTQGITQRIPGNNKSAKSLGMIFYLLTKLYVEKRKIKAEVPPIQDFIDDWDNLQPPK